MQNSTTCQQRVHKQRDFGSKETQAQTQVQEREWQRDNSAINRSRYRATVNHFNRLLECAKTKYYSNMVRENEDNPKGLWNSIKKVLHRSPKIVLPDHTNINSLINTFGRYFADKIAKLRSGLLSTDADPPVSGFCKNKFFLSGPCQRKKSLKSLSPHQINHVTWIQSQHHWSLTVLVWS